MLNTVRYALPAFVLLCCWGHCLGASGVLEQSWQPPGQWEPGRKIGASKALNGATATTPVLTSGRAPDAGIGWSFDFGFGSDDSASNLEAETAQLLGASTYADTANASGGMAVGNFGRNAGDAIIFTNVVAATELNVLYNNGTGSGKQCSLYIGGQKAATLRLTNAAGWYVPFVPARYEGKVSGEVKLQVDAADLAANGGDFCCNVDRIVLGPVKPRPEIEVRVEPGEVDIEQGMTYFTCAVRGPKGFAFSLGLEDSAPIPHWSHGVVVQQDNAWEDVAVAFGDFDPKLDAATPGRLKAILVHARSGRSGVKGALSVGGVKFTAGWPSDPPADCPFPRSELFAGVRFTGRHAEYTGADTWYPSWALDGNLYSPWTDGNVNGLGSGSAGKDATTGHATILGDDPLKLQVVEQGIYKSDPTPYAGRYPCGSLVYNGVWYYGTYCLHPSGGVPRDGINYNWPWLGPFVGFRYSTDLGKTWTQTPCTPAKPLFGESALNGEPVKIGSPHFVDFGKNLEHAPDGKAYLVGHGASDGTNRRYAYNSWITGDEIYLVRVTPSIQNINDASNYEFSAGDDEKGEPTWSKQFAKIKPIAAWRDNMGCVTLTYNAPLRRYLMCVTDGGNTVHYFNSYILESDRITGPWKVVSYLKHFGEQAYFVNIPSKFISADGRTFWLCYAANFSSGWGGVKFLSRPSGSRYGMCLQEVNLLPAKKP